MAEPRPGRTPFIGGRSSLLTRHTWALALHRGTMNQASTFLRERYHNARFHLKRWKIPSSIRITSASGLATTN